MSAGQIIANLITQDEIHNERQYMDSDIICMETVSIDMDVVSFDVFYEDNILKVVVDGRVGNEWINYVLKATWMITFLKISNEWCEFWAEDKDVSMKDDIFTIKFCSMRGGQFALCDDVVMSEEIVLDLRYDD